MHHFGKGRIFAQSNFGFCIYYLKLKLRYDWVNKLDGESVIAVSILRELIVLIRYLFLFTRGGGGGAAGVCLQWWGRDSERPVAHTRQKMAQAPHGATYWSRWLV